MIVLRAARIGLGLLHLVAPGLGARRLTGQPFDRTTRRVVRILGTRHLAQALISGSRPTRAVLALGAEVDASHAASMTVLALVDARRRRPALASALVAATFAAAGARFCSLPLTGGIEPETAGLADFRDRGAERLARWTVPGYRARISVRTDAPSFLSFRFWVAPCSEGS